MTHAARIRARVLAATAEDDILIPGAQDAGFVRAIRRGRPGAHAVSLPLSPGDGLFVHGSASSAALAGFDRAVAELVAPFGSAPGVRGEPAPVLRFALGDDR